MLLYAKSALNKEQLDRKVEIGCDGIEIQLLSELVDGEIGKYKSAEEAFDLPSFKDYDVRVIHAPILSFYGMADVTLEDFVDDDIFLFEQVFKIAEYFGEVNNRMTDIVVHSESTVEIMESIGNTWSRATIYIGYLLFKYPHTRLLIENVTPNRGTLDKLTLTNNFLFDNIDMAKRLRKDLCTNRIGTVLDVCHALISMKYIGAMCDMLEIPRPDMSLESYMIKHQPTISLIHFAGMKGSGYGRGAHGTVPTEDLNHTFVQLYNKHNYGCPVTLEVEETNFLVSGNYAEAYENIKRFI